MRSLQELIRHTVADSSINPKKGLILGLAELIMNFNGNHEVNITSRDQALVYHQLCPINYKRSAKIRSIACNISQFILLLSWRQNWRSLFCLFGIFFINSELLLSVISYDIFLIVPRMRDFVFYHLFGN